MSKEDLLKIKNKYYVSLYCKNDIGVETDFIYEEETVDIPDEHLATSSPIACPINEPITHFDDIYMPPKFIIKVRCQCECNDVNSSKNSNDNCTLLLFGPPCFEGSTNNTPISSIY
ncbi:hypothetical protein H8356DRAFT_1342712 [Neocallimastix lanati (nom. inval.)]|nr:hypothetical protein H8356DRAFT_1342712 [Neocallimastix sp. JGI-2020a]